MDEIRCSIKIEQRAEGEPARLVGVLMPYGTQAKDRSEIFAPGSLTWEPDGVILRRQHDRSQPIMRVIPIIEGTDVRIDQPLPETQAGREAALEIRQGLLRGLSVEFQSVRQSVVGGIRRISEALLVGAGLVDEPSYQSATVEARERALRDREWERWQQEMIL